MAKQNRKDLIKETKEAVQLYTNNGLKDHLESLDENERLDNFTVSIYVKDNSLTNWKKGVKFIKGFDTKLMNLIKSNELTIEEYGLLSFLALYLDYQDNYLKLNEDTYLTQKDIMKVTGFGRKKISTMLNKLINKKLLFEEKQKDDKRLKCYFVNPHFYYRGQMIDKEIKKRFTDS